MAALGQLLHTEDYQLNGQAYRLFVYRADGGMMGRWQCGACQADHDHEDCLAFSSVDGCLDSMRRAIAGHHNNSAAPAERSCPRCRG